MPCLKVTGVGSGRKSDKPWRHSLLRAVNERDPKTKEKYLDIIARRCVKAALQGDMTAINEIANRIDGRHITIEGNGDQPVTLISRIERVIVDAVAGEEVVIPLEDRTH